MDCIAKVLSGHFHLLDDANQGLASLGCQISFQHSHKHIYSLFREGIRAVSATSPPTWGGIFAPQDFTPFIGQLKHEVLLKLFNVVWGISIRKRSASICAISFQRNRVSVLPEWLISGLPCFDFIELTLVRKSCCCYCSGIVSGQVRPRAGTPAVPAGRAGRGRAAWGRPPVRGAAGGWSPASPLLPAGGSRYRTKTRPAPRLRGCGAGVWGENRMWWKGAFQADSSFSLSWP